MSSISKGYRGFAERPLSEGQLLELFDKIWGEESRKFPTFPEVVGGISAFWCGADGIKHNVNDINEILDAYKQELTYDIHITGQVNKNPRCGLVYIPARTELIFQITAPNEEVVDRYIGYIEEMFPKKEIPILFISYASEELALADFVKKILRRLTIDKIDIFVATRDIPPGDNPLKVMMEQKLKSAQAIIPICSHKSKSSGWVWWESAVVWAKERKVYPLFTNISPNEFGAPLTLISQGKNLFDEVEFTNTLKMVCEQFGIIGSGCELLGSEREEFLKLKDEYSKLETSVKVIVDFKKITMTQEFHKYSFVFETENRSNKKFNDIIVQLCFPAEYLERKEWDYSHLKSSIDPEDDRYVCLTFAYSSMPQNAQTQHMSGLLPKNKLKIFGEDGITKLYYEMDHDRWYKRFQYEVRWKIYVDGGAPQEGSIPLNKIQFF